MRCFKDHVTFEIQQLLDTCSKAKKVWDKLRKPGQFYRVVISVYLPVYTQHGKVRRYDASNRLKIPEDAVMELLGVDDTNVIEVVGQKLDHSMGDYGEQYYWSIRIDSLGKATPAALVALKETEGAAKATQGIRPIRWTRPPEGAARQSLLAAHGVQRQLAKG